jgi:hypothetical protein
VKVQRVEEGVELPAHILCKDDEEELSLHGQECNPRHWRRGVSLAFLFSRHKAML